MVVLQCPVCGAGLMPGAVECGSCRNAASRRESDYQDRQRESGRSIYSSLYEEIPDPYARLIRVGKGFHCDERTGEPKSASEWIHLAIPEFTSAPQDKLVGQDFPGVIPSPYSKATIPDLDFDDREVGRWYARAPKIDPSTQMRTTVKHGWWRKREVHREGWLFPHGVRASLALDGGSLGNLWVFLDGSTSGPVGLYGLYQMSKNVDWSKL